MNYESIDPYAKYLKEKGMQSVLGKSLTALSWPRNVWMHISLVPNCSYFSSRVDGRGYVPYLRGEESVYREVE